MMRAQKNGSNDPFAWPFRLILGAVELAVGGLVELTLRWLPKPRKRQGVVLRLLRKAVWQRR